MRLRARDGDNLLTIKQGSRRVRDEHETTVEPARFARLWPLTEGHRIEKTRYLIPAEQGLVIELDHYAGALDGLVTAEVEFHSVAQAEDFTPPARFRPEVTRRSSLLQPAAGRRRAFSCAGAQTNVQL